MLTSSLGSSWHKQKQSLEVFWLKKFLQNSCYIILSTESIGKICEKCLKRSSFFSKTAGILPPKLPKTNSFTSIFQRFCPKSQNTYVVLIGCFRITFSFICLLESFTAIIRYLTWLLNSLSIERCFHRNKYLDIHWYLCQWCLWQHRYHPLVKLHSIQKVFFSLDSALAKLNLTLLKSLLLLTKFEIT